MIGHSFAATPLIPTTSVRSGWHWYRLTELARLATGHTPSRRHPEYWDGDIPWIQLPDIRALDGQTATDTSERINELGIQNSAAVLLPAGTVCLSRTASVAFVTIMGRPMATSQDFVNWVCGPDLDPHFLMYLLLANRQAIRDLGSGAVHQTVYFPTVESFSVCVPQVKEQRRIAAGLAQQLAAADEAKRAADERAAAAEALQTAFLHAAFDVGAGRWRKSKLADLAEISGGLQKTPGRKPVASHCPYLTVRNVQRGRLDLSHVERFEVSQTELKRLRLVKGDILIVEGNGSPDQIGRNAVFDLEDTNWIHQNHVIRVRLGTDALYEFVSLFLNSPEGKAQMLQRARSTSGLYTLSVAKVGSLEVPLPSITEQARLVRDLTSRIWVAEQLLERCREDGDTVAAVPPAVLRATFGGDL